MKPIDRTDTDTDGATFHNWSAAFIWAFAAAFIFVLASMTWVVLRDGVVSSHATFVRTSYPLWFLTLGLAVFWVGAAGLLAFAANRPCLTVAIAAEGYFSVTRRYLFRVESRRVEPRSYDPAMTVESRDDEGAPYFYARVRLHEGMDIDLSESHYRDDCERECARFNRWAVTS